MSIDKKTLEIFEDLPLRADDAWYVLLVYLGLKPAVWAGIRSSVWREGDTEKIAPELTLKIIEESLNALGLVYQIEHRNTDAGLRQPEEGFGRRRFNEIVDIYVAKEQSILDNIIKARKAGDHKLIGLSLGYPKTAVDTFATDRAILASGLSPKVQLSETGQLAYFALSKEHWENELAVVGEWIAAVKSTSPIMWNELRSFADLVDDEFVDIAIKSRE